MASEASRVAAVGKPTYCSSSATTRELLEMGTLSMVGTWLVMERSIHHTNASGPLARHPDQSSGRPNVKAIVNRRRGAPQPSPMLGSKALVGRGDPPARVR